MDERRADPVLFEGLYEKPARISFDEPFTSSDGGVVLLNAADRILDLTSVFVEQIPDARQAGKVRHTVEQLVRQRVLGIACGYADANDAARLAHDPLMRVAAGRSCNDEDALAGQSTLSRFENSMNSTTLFRIGCGLATAVLDHEKKRRRRRKPRLVTIDLDPTDDPTHGQQQFAFFNGHYGNWCYLPLAAFVSFDEDPMQYLVTSVLRPGNASAMRGAICVLRRLVGMIRERWPKARVRVRLDGGYATPTLFEWLEWSGVEYLVAMASNKRLDVIAEPVMRASRREQRQTGGTARRFGECRYAAKSWDRERRVIFKAEVVVLDGRAPRDNCRFVVTNMRHAPDRIYDIYRQRGDAENRIKELHQGVEIGRTSCTSFLANALRVLMSSAAYMLLQILREQAPNDELRRAQVWTLRERLIKVAARVRITWRRIEIHLPAAFAWRQSFRQLTMKLGAQLARAP
jgi:hypothetical protein